MAGVAEMADYQPCPKSGCRGGGVVTADQTDAACNVCGVCWKFLPIAGTGTGTGSGSDSGCWRLFSSDRTARWKKRRTKQCPKCNTAIEKNGGCAHMTCTRCKYTYCWICLKDTAEGSHATCSSWNSWEMSRQWFEDNWHTVLVGTLFAALFLYGCAHLYALIQPTLSAWNTRVNSFITDLFAPFAGTAERVGAAIRDVAARLAGPILGAMLTAAASAIVRAIWDTFYTRAGRRSVKRPLTILLILSMFGAWTCLILDKHASPFWWWCGLWSLVGLLRVVVLRLRAR